MGHVLLEACDGAEGLTVSRNFSGRIDLVVSEVRMPKMDGPEMISRLQTERPGIRVLFMSASIYLPLSRGRQIRVPQDFAGQNCELRLQYGG